MLGWDGPHAKNCRVVYEMKGHAKKCAERYCELADEKTEQLFPVSTSCLDDRNFKKEKLETDGELSNVCSQIVSLKCLKIGQNW